MLELLNKQKVLDELTYFGPGDADPGEVTCLYRDRINMLDTIKVSEITDENIITLSDIFSELKKEINNINTQVKEGYCDNENFTATGIRNKLAEEYRDEVFAILDKYIIGGK